MGAQFRVQLQEQHQEAGPPPSSQEGRQEAQGQPPAESGGKPGERKGGDKPGGRKASKGKSLEERAAAADRARGKAPEAEPEESKGEPPANTLEGDEKPVDEKPPSEPTGDLKLSTEARTALGLLLTSGKLQELADAVGVDRKTVDISSGKLAISRKRVQEATAAERAAKEIREECKRLYKDPHSARKAVDEGRFHDAVEYLHHILGMDFATFTQHVAKATKGMSPEELERYKRERSLESRERALEARERQTEQERTKEEQTGRAVRTIETKLAGHDALKLKGGAKLIYHVLDAAFDPKKGTLSKGYKQAADEVLNEFLENAKALGYSKGAPAAPAPKKDAEETAERKPGKKEFEAPAGERPDESGGRPRKGRSFEERSALASRNFERSRL